MTDTITTTLTVDEYLDRDLPDPDECAYCAETMQEVQTAVMWQGVTIERDSNDDLDITDYGSQDSEPDGREWHVECRSASHQYATLEELDACQREQHALRMLVMSAPDHVWNEHGDEPGTELRLRAIYSTPMFSGRRSRMARAERVQFFNYASVYASRERWARFLALDSPPLATPETLAEITGVPA